MNISKNKNKNFLGKIKSICLVYPFVIIWGVGMPVEDILIDFWVLEDSPFSDITSEVLPLINVEARILSKDEGILAGRFIVEEICRRHGVKIKFYKDDGDTLTVGDVIAELSGESKKILLIERLIVNLLMYLSGIATTTRKFREKIERINPKIRIAATRKTIPGLRWLSKKAVEIGGGDTHRFSLSDCILIKDNHIKIIGDIDRAISLAKKKASFTKLVEIEVRNVDEAIKAAEAGADIIMFDNMKPEEIKRAIEEIKRLGLRERIKLEVSGGINLENVEKYAKLDIDVISTSIITLGPKPIDITLKIAKIL